MSTARTARAMPATPPGRRSAYYPDFMSRKARELLRTLEDARFAATQPYASFAVPIHLDFARQLAGEIIGAGCAS